MPAASLYVGLIGVRCPLADTLVPALQAQQRFTIASIYDSCFQAARDLAAPLKAKPAPSLVQMLETHNLDGVIILDTNWQRTHPLFLACCQQIPTLFVPNVLDTTAGNSDPFIVEQLRNLASEHRTLLMPTFAHRWSPSVLRLQELCASKLGRVEAIQVHCDIDDQETLLQWVDWSCHLAQSKPISVCACQSGELKLSFQRKTSQLQPMTATFQLQATNRTAEIRCERGTATLHNEHHIRWSESSWDTSNTASEDSCHEEDLRDERSNVAVMLDLFGRRLSGGLVPVPALEDVIRCHHITEKFHESLRTGTTKTL